MLIKFKIYVEQKVNEIKKREVELYILIFQQYQGIDKSNTLLWIVINQECSNISIIGIVIDKRKNKKLLERNLQ